MLKEQGPPIQYQDHKEKYGKYDASVIYLPVIYRPYRARQQVRDADTEYYRYENCQVFEFTH